MNEQNFMNLTCRVAAMEYLFSLFASDLYRLARFDLDRVKARHQQIASNMSELSVPGVDPAMSDHLAAELQTAVEEILRRVEVNLAPVTGKAPT